MEESLNIEIIKNVWIALITYYTNFKIINKTQKIDLGMIIKTLIVIISSTICVFVKQKLGNLINIALLMVIIGLTFSKDNVKKRSNNNSNVISNKF